MFHIIIIITTITINYNHRIVLYVRFDKMSTHGSFWIFYSELTVSGIRDRGSNRTVLPPE